MSNIYFCYVRDTFGEVLYDDFRAINMCMLSFRDISFLIRRGYSVEIDGVVAISSRSYHRYCLKQSHCNVSYILNFDKLPSLKTL